MNTLFQYGRSTETQAELGVVEGIIPLRPRQLVYIKGKYYRVAETPVLVVGEGLVRQMVNLVNARQPK